MFNFYDSLSEKQKYNYNTMLNVHFLLLVCDEFDFYESKQSKISKTWLFSLKHILYEFDFPTDAYPEGSLTANRLFVEIYDKYYKKNHGELNEFKQKIFNFLSFRRDDDSYNNSYLFGSTYDIVTYKASQSSTPKKIVDVGLRHSISALNTILILTDKYSNQFLSSLDAVNIKMSEFLKKNQEWANDKYKFLTIASYIYLYNHISRNGLKTKYLKQLDVNYKKGLYLFLNDIECINEKLNGGFEFSRFPKKDAFSDYHFFFETDALILIPELLKYKKIQLIIEEFINNGIDTHDGFGIPIFPNDFNLMGDKKPDFGISSSILYLLWYSLENQIGDNHWLTYCKKYFFKLLNFCINNFQNIDYYLFLISENYSKILLMPNFSPSNDLEIQMNLKKAIHREVSENVSCFNKVFKKLSLGNEYNIVKEIIEKWDYKSTINKMNTKYKFTNDLHVWVGEIVGAFFKIYNL